MAREFTDGVLKRLSLESQSFLVAIVVRNIGFRRKVRLSFWSSHSDVVISAGSGVNREKSADKLRLSFETSIEADLG